MTRRVVVTGVGMVTPVGNTADAAFKAMLAGENGIGPITKCDAEGLSSQLAGEIKDFDPTPYFASAKEAKRYDPFVQYTMAAGTEAMEQHGTRHRLYIAVGQQFADACQALLFSIEEAKHGRQRNTRKRRLRRATRH